MCYTSSGTAARSEKSGVLLDVYIQFWCLHRIYETIGGGNQTLGWSFAEQVVIMALAAITAMKNSVGLMCFTIFAVLVADAIKVPFIWDSEFWCIQTDLAMLLSVLSTCGPNSLVFWKATSSQPNEAERSLIYEGACNIIRRQMIVFYSAAAFWKLNKDFMNPHCSCAPIFPLQLLDLLWPSSAPMPSTAVWLLVLTSPALVLLVEGGLAFGLLLRPKVGVTLALALHLGIALCPPPNNVSPFSLMCATRLVAFVPLGAAKALKKEWTQTRIALTGVAVAVATQLANHEFFFDSGLPIFIGLFPLMCDAVFFQPDVAFPHVAEDRLKYPRLFRFGRRCLVALTVAYAYLLIPLGVQDQGQPHMYANLRMHGGSNHYLMPTALLQKTFEHSTSSFGGGVVRVEKSSSTYFNEICPGDYTSDMTVRTQGWLKAAGHSGLMFNPMLNAVTSSEATWDISKGPFIQYTLPAHEFRRMLEVARSKKESFIIEYTQLSGYGDDEWRSVSPGRTVKVHEDASKGIRKCKVMKPKPGRCGEDDLPNLPPLSWWAQKFLLFEAYPVIPNDFTLQCFGP